ncbi:hypothetical protein [Bacillus sp. SJS]|uniref:hypothetical protein n=1 Tax=Bacillus sp. SJS TaxID=1423321 RepID=UPI0004DCBD61|nr:hypothetical protein [Bacillus sp. SJS]KZZ83377.1 hypothetical protein AS29_016635 [Bacillus sp. SJS]
MLKVKAIAGLLILTVLSTLIWFAQLQANEHHGKQFVLYPNRRVSELEMNGPRNIWHVPEPKRVESFSPREYVKVIPRS